MLITLNEGMYNEREVGVEEYLKEELDASDMWRDRADVQKETTERLVCVVASLLGGLLEKGVLKPYEVDMIIRAAKYG